MDIVLDMNSLPSAQGWTYVGDSGAVETSVFSVSGGMLHQNSIGIGATGSQGGASYSFFGVVDPALPFVLTMRVRVNQEEFAAANPTNAFGFGTGPRTGTNESFVGLGADRVEVIHSSTRPMYVRDTTAQFHDYRMEGGGGTFSVFVDGSLLDSGTSLATAGANALILGDLTRGPNASADIASFEFVQTPEPAALAMLGLGAAAVLGLRRRRTA